MKKCKVCSRPTFPEWEVEAKDICKYCEEKDAATRSAETKSDIEYFTHVCKSCFTPHNFNSSKTLLGLLLKYFSNKTYCPICEREALIPINTPKAQEIMKRTGYKEN